MNKGLANILKGLLVPDPDNGKPGIPVIDKFGGLVYVAEFDDKIYPDEGGEKIITTLLPLTNDVSFTPAYVDDYLGDAAGIGSRSMVPDNHYRGLLYFEDNGVKVMGRENGRIKYTSRLRLVGWINSSWVETVPNFTISALLTSKIIGIFNNAMNTNINNYIRLHITVTDIPKPDKSLFSAYTYNLKDTQYLLPPYEVFGLDISTEFQMHESCIDSITLLTPEQKAANDNCTA